MLLSSSIAVTMTVPQPARMMVPLYSKTAGYSGRMNYR